MLRALLTAAALLVAGAAAAQAPIAYYVAVPAAQATKAQLMTHSTPWSLQNGAYVANRAPERDGIVCQLVAKQAGKLQSFAVAGKPLDPKALAACNARAR